METDRWMDGYVHEVSHTVESHTTECATMRKRQQREQQEGINMGVSKTRPPWITFGMDDDCFWVPPIFFFSFCSYQERYILEDRDPRNFLVQEDQLVQSAQRYWKNNDP